MVQCHEDSRHGLSDGDFVRFEEIEGMTELNSAKPQAVKVTSPFSFSICDTLSFKDYTDHGLFYEVKQGAKLSFLSLSEILMLNESELTNWKSPKILQTDFTKSPYEQHLFYLALQEFRDSNGGKLPLPTSHSEAEKVFARFDQLCKENKFECDKNAKTKFCALARASSACINPMCAFLGGIVAQEVLKACSHKFTPLQQLLYFDAYECLPNISVADFEKEFAPTNSRYDDNIAVFGKTLQQKVLESKLFLVGAGAIGCEMLKNWALMGVGCDPNKKGSVVVTDMDQIETSNLNRQFLFRSVDVGSAKSESASKAIKQMNSDINIVAHQNRVGSDSEIIYNWDFWKSQDAVCTALDNVQARLYVDAQCVYYNLPLLESGTLGTKGNTQVVVPKMTESYGSTRDPDEKGVPICTLKNFPNKIEHTIQWARDDFEGFFNQTVIEINGYLSLGTKYLDELHQSNPAEELSILSKIKLNLGTTDGGSRPLHFKECVHWARNKFEQDFSNRIKQLLYNFPHDAVTTEGAKFWSPPKRAPLHIDFDQSDPLHLGYITAAANLRAFVYGLKGTKDANEIKKMLSDCVVPEFSVDAKAKIAVTDEEEKKNQEAMDIDYDQEIANLVESLPKRKDLIGMKLRPIEFEKDDDTNFHMDFIQCSANLRARNYRIQEKSKHEIKKIAGKIIPAIATTTALVTGLISLEFYKLLQNENGQKKIEDFRSSYVNLALPLVTMSEPVQAPQTTIYKKGKEWNYSLWDVIEIKDGKDLTVKGLMDYFDEEWDCDLNMISYGNAMIYAFYMNAAKLMQRKKMKLIDLVEEVCKIKIDKGVKCLNFEVNCDYQNVPDDDEEEPLLPTVAVYL